MISVAVAAEEYLDSLDGFRGVKFGTAFSEFKDLTVDQDHDFGQGEKLDPKNTIWQGQRRLAQMA